MFMFMQAIKDSLIFTLFFFMINLFFAILFNQFGVIPNLDDYPGCHYYASLYIMVYRNSIGDISAPSYDYWNSISVDGHHH